MPVGSQVPRPFVDRRRAARPYAQVPVLVLLLMRAVMAGWFQGCGGEGRKSGGQRQTLGEFPRCLEGFQSTARKARTRPDKKQRLLSSTNEVVGSVRYHSLIVEAPGVKESVAYRTVGYGTVRYGRVRLAVRSTLCQAQVLRLAWTTDREWLARSLARSLLASPPALVKLVVSVFGENAGCAPLDQSVSRLPEQQTNIEQRVST